ncbi:spore protease YyaC [Paenisporosarcina sp. TG20]|uniref:spore protease YyaC n=1 Tax=Paenisporosarcina sp. TG20 TaxID=1211706 RepID=UPI00047526C9|nr:spore protease YyaC [Paenisporosarcina sp. TG20]
MLLNSSHLQPEEFSYQDIGVAWRLSSLLLQLIPFEKPSLTFCCIGTDRSTGDALGPLVGTWLGEHSTFPYEVIGTLQKPLHALNLHQTVESLQERTIKPYVVAIDACLGRIEKIGHIVIENGPLLPGKAVKKVLPPIGDLSIKGIVNICGFQDYTVLQNTRLQLSYDMGKVLSRALLLAWQRHQLKLVNNSHYNNYYKDTWQ